MNVQRGDVVLVNFPFISGSGVKLRPALVVQSDRNNSRLSNTIVAMITRTTHRATREPTQLLIDHTSAEGRRTGLKMMSAITCENLLTIDQSRIHHKIGHVPASTIKEVDSCLKASLALS